MVFKPFELKLTDLPKELEIEMPHNASSSDVEEMLESVRSQVVYNSRLADEERPAPSPKVEVLGRKGDLVKLRVAAG